MPGARGRSGGARRNAGRKPGVPNKVTLEREKELREAAGGKDLPLDFMLRVLRGEPVEITVMKDGRPTTETYHPTFEDRKWAAQMAGPYSHPRLNAVDATGDVNVRHEDALAELE